jgi:hypothetical protein
VVQEWFLNDRPNFFEGSLNAITLAEIASEKAFSAQFGDETSLQRTQVGSVDVLQRSYEVLGSHQSIAEFAKPARASLIGQKLDHSIGL